jgi:hypothetical protein
MINLVWLFSRFSPYEWTPQSQPPEGKAPFVPEEGMEAVDPSATNPFTIDNTLWFSLGALMQQGSDISPRYLQVQPFDRHLWKRNISLSAGRSSAL